MAKARGASLSGNYKTRRGCAERAPLAQRGAYAVISHTDGAKRELLTRVYFMVRPQLLKDFPAEAKHAEELGYPSRL